MRISDWSSDVCSSDLINSDIDFVCGVGWDDLRLRRAIRSGDTIHVTSEIVELRPSQTRDDRGTALIRYAVVTDDGTEAVTLTSINLVYTRLGRDRRRASASAYAYGVTMARSPPAASPQGRI